MRHFAAPPAGFRVGNPCSKYWGQKMATNKPQAYGSTLPYTPCGYNPQQMQGAYGVSGAIKSGVNGRGQTVAIIDAYFAPTIRFDLSTYSSRHHLPAPKLRQFIVPPAAGNGGEKQGWYGEETMDLEAVHSMAPGANLVYEGAYSSQDLDILNRVVDVIDNHRASIVTNSYGNIGEDVSPAEVAAEEAAYQQAISEGIAFLFSSGDCGDEIDPQGICGGLGTAAADFPASSPSVTAVGGTSLAVGANQSYLFETGWGTAWSSLSSDGLSWDPAPGSGYFFYGSGGGTSQLFAEPSYQQGVVPDALAGRFGGSGRVVPDIATDGDPNTGFTIGETQTWPDGSVSYDEFRLGGTSLSSPLLAGILALANQRAGHALGFINPRLYEDLAGTNALRDIVDPASTVAVVRTNFSNGTDATGGRSYSMRTMNQDGTLVTTPGYDDVTGLGTPNGWAFLKALADE
jgi:subtilase family serine protease